MYLQSNPIGLAQTKKFIYMFVFVASFLFIGFVSSPQAHAVETTVTGKVSTLTNFESGFVWAETQVSSSWQFVLGSDTEIKGETRTLNIGDNTEIDLG